MEFWSTHPSLSSESQSAVTAMYLAMQLSYGTVAFIPSYRSDQKVIILYIKILQIHPYSRICPPHP